MIPIALQLWKLLMPFPNDREDLLTIMEAVTVPEIPDAISLSLADSTVFLQSIPAPDHPCCCFAIYTAE